MTSNPFPTNPVLTGIAIAYKNDQSKYIYSRVLPTVPVVAREFEWIEYNTPENYRIPDTAVGRISRPNQVEFTGTRKGDSVIDYALDSPVPQSDIDAAIAGYDPLQRATMQVADLVMLDREKRCADLVFTLGTYDSTVRTTLSGTSQWSDYTNSDPITAINAALDIPLVRPNIWVIGRAAWTVLRSHPKVINALRGYEGTTITSGNFGMVAAQDLAAYFELDELIIGDSRSNTARLGQAGSYSRLWGKHSAFLVRNSFAGLTGGGVTFGMTAQFGSSVAATIPDANIGMKGGVYVRVGESVKEVIASNLAGYFFQNCIA